MFVQVSIHGLYRALGGYFPEVFNEYCSVALVLWQLAGRESRKRHKAYIRRARVFARNPEFRVSRTSWTALALEVGKSPTATTRRAELPVA